MKITCTKHEPVNINASSDDYDWGSDEQYLMKLADEIESVLYTDFDIEASVFSDGAYIHITMDIDDEDAQEGLITPNELVGLTGDVESDAYQFAEEFYCSI